jgi:hypothetical protein
MESAFCAHAGRVIWFAPFDANACEALAARLGLLLIQVCFES